MNKVYPTLILFLIPLHTFAGGCAEGDTTCEDSLSSFFTLLFGYKVFPIALIIITLIAIAVSFTAWSFIKSVDVMADTHKNQEKNSIIQPRTRNQNKN